MNKEEILAMSRQENKNQDLVDREIENKATTCAGIVMTVMCCVYYMAELMIQGKRSSGFFSVAAIYNAILFIMKGVKLQDRRKLSTGILWLVLAIGLAIEHFYTLVVTSTIL